MLWAVVVPIAIGALLYCYAILSDQINPAESIAKVVIRSEYFRRLSPKIL